MKEIIGKNVKKYREIRGMSKVDLAKLAGYAYHSSIFQLESGKQGVSSEKLKRIADILGVSVDDLTKGYSSTDDEELIEKGKKLSEKEELELMNKEFRNKLKSLAVIHKRINKIIGKMK